MWFEEKKNCITFPKSTEKDVSALLYFRIAQGDETLTKIDIEVKEPLKEETQQQQLRQLLKTLTVHPHLQELSLFITSSIGFELTEWRTLFAKSPQLLAFSIKMPRDYIKGGQPGLNALSFNPILQGIAHTRTLKKLDLLEVNLAESLESVPLLCQLLMKSCSLEEIAVRYLPAGDEDSVAQTLNLAFRKVFSLIKITHIEKCYYGRRGGRVEYEPKAGFTAVTERNQRLIKGEWLYFFCKWLVQSRKQQSDLMDVQPLRLVLEYVSSTWSQFSAQDLEALLQKKAKQSTYVIQKPIITHSGTKFEVKEKTKDALATPLPTSIISSRAEGVEIKSNKPESFSEEGEEVQEEKSGLSPHITRELRGIRRAVESLASSVQALVAEQRILLQTIAAWRTTPFTFTITPETHVLPSQNISETRSQPTLLPRRQTSETFVNSPVTVPIKSPEIFSKT